MRNDKKLFLAILVAFACGLLLAGCSTHYIPKDLLVEQLKGKEELRPRPKFTSTHIFTGTKDYYWHNNIKEILCLNDQGDKVPLKVGLKSMLIIRDKHGETFKFYLDTAYIEENKIRGMRSRILDIINEVNLQDIDKAEIYREF